MALHNLLSPCLLKDADMQSFLWSVAFLLVLISNFMNADEEVIKLRNTQ